MSFDILRIVSVVLCAFSLFVRLAQADAGVVPWLINRVLAYMCLAAMILLVFTPPAQAATIQPEQLPGPMTAIDPIIQATTLQVSHQFPQSIVVTNAQYTLFGYFSLTDPARAGVWSPAAQPWEPEPFRLVPTLPAPASVPAPVAPDIPEPGTYAIVLAGGLLMIAQMSRRLK